MVFRGHLRLPRASTGWHYADLPRSANSFYPSSLLTTRHSPLATIPFVFIQFRTLLRNGALPTPFPSITSALFPIQRGVGGSRLPNSRFLRPHLTTFSLRYILPSSVCAKPFVCHSYENCRGVPSFFPIRNNIHLPSCSVSAESVYGDSSLFTCHESRVTSPLRGSSFLFHGSRITGHGSLFFSPVTNHESQVTAQAGILPLPRSTDYCSHARAVV
jgi:hypothetical protein